MLHFIITLNLNMIEPSKASPLYYTNVIDELLKARYKKL